MIGDAGVCGAGSDDEFPAMLFKAAQVGIFGVQQGAEFGGVGVDVSCEVDGHQIPFFPEYPAEQIEVSAGDVERASERDAVEDALPGRRMDGAAEEKAQRLRVFGGQRGILFHRKRNDRLDVCRRTARIGDDFSRDHGNFPGSHVFISGGDYVRFLFRGEWTFLKNLEVPEKIGVQRRTAVGGEPGEDSIIILRIPLRFLQSLRLVAYP